MENKNKDQNQENILPSPFAQTYFHGTKADLQIGDFIQIGYTSNFIDKKLKHVYVSSTLHAAILAAELAQGEGKDRIYLVEPTGDLEDDPNVTDKKFPGNPTKSYRSIHPFKVIAEVSNWNGHSDEFIHEFKAGLAKLTEQGINVIID